MTNLFIVSIWLSLCHASSVDCGSIPLPKKDDKIQQVKTPKSLHNPINLGSVPSSLNSIANFNNDPSKLDSEHFGTGWNSINPQMYGVDGFPSLHAPGKCISIPPRMALCRDIGYKKMLIPNFLDHYTVAEAVHHSNSWIGVRSASCHKDIRTFLCSLYAPLCIQGQGLRPCRSMCESVRDACEPILKKLNHSWPEMFTCSQFPQEDQLCLRTQVDKICQSCKPASSPEHALDLFCRAEFVVKANVEESLATEDHLKVSVGGKMKVLRFVPREHWTHRKNLHNVTFHVKGGYSCDCPQLETIDGVRDNSSLLFIGTFEDESNNVRDLNVLSDLKNSSDKKLARIKRVRGKLYVRNVLVLSRNVRKMLQRVAEEMGKVAGEEMGKVVGEEMGRKGGHAGVEALCKERTKLEPFKPALKVPSRDKNKKMKKDRRMKNTKSGLEPEKSAEGFNSPRDKKRRKTSH